MKIIVSGFILTLARAEGYKQNERASCKTNGK